MIDQFKVGWQVNKSQSTVMVPATEARKLLTVWGDDPHGGGVGVKVCGSIDDQKRQLRIRTRQLPPLMQSLAASPKPP
jgi:hypothetical protein